MLPDDMRTVLHGAAAVAALLSAATVLLGGRDRAHLWLGVFLALIAANQAAEMMRTFADESAAATWHRVATVYAAFDPLALYLFAATFPRRNALANWPALAAVLLGASVLAFAAPWFPNGPMESALIGSYHAIFTAAVYTIVLVHVGREVMRRPEDRAMQLLFVGLCVATVPVWRDAVGVPTSVVFLLVSGTHGVEQPSALFSWLNTPRFLAVGAFVVALLVWARRAPPAPARTLRLGAYAGAAVTFVINLNVLGVAYLWLDPDGPVILTLNTLGRTAAATRWILFSALASIALLRFDLLGMSLATRRRASRAIVALAFIGVAASAIVLLGPRAAGAGVRPLDIIILGAALVASQAFGKLVDWVAAWFYAVPSRADPTAAIETYRLAATQAMREGGITRARPKLDRLREELELSLRDARMIEHLAEGDAGVPLASGVVVGGRYEIARPIGRGGGGRAFLAHDELLDRDVVLKEIDAPESDALVREARAASAVAHPNVLVVHDALRREGAVILVTEHAPGGSLAQRLERGPLPLFEAARILDGILAGLEAVHARGIVHRDLKPGNVLLAEDGTPKIADFGVARVRRAGETARWDAADAFVGTPEFMAPEQREGGVATPATDLFAVGRTMSLMLGPDIRAPLRAVIERALVADPAERFASAAQMRAALRDAFARHA